MADSAEPGGLPETRGELTRRLQARVFRRGDLVFRADLSRKTVGAATSLTVHGRVEGRAREGCRERRPGAPSRLWSPSAERTRGLGRAGVRWRERSPGVAVPGSPDPLTGEPGQGAKFNAAQGSGAPSPCQRSQGLGGGRRAGAWRARGTAPTPRARRARSRG